MNELNILVEKCKILLAKHGIVWKESFLQWSLPSQVKADLALEIALPLANVQKIPPTKVAKQIIEFINYPHWQWNFTPNGYINVTLPLSYYQEFLKNNYLKKGRNLAGKKTKKRINIEFVSANPTGYLHLAHFRQAFFGDALANVYQFCGYQVTREYLVNDRGGQISSLINSVNHFYHRLQGFSEPIILEKIDYPGLASQETAQFLIKKWGKKYLNKKLTKEELIIWKKEILHFILNKIHQDLEECEVKFDVWFSETSLYDKKKHLELLSQLKKKDLIYNHEGAVFFRSSLGNDEKDRVIIKKDEDYTYFFSDIIYHQEKFQRADQLINIWGADHHGAIPRLKSACYLLGYPAENLQIILVQMANLLTTEGEKSKFSKRVGNTIELSEALKYINKEQLRFFCLEKDANQSLTINTQLLQEQQEKTRLYYLQYAHARCQQIFEKAKQKGLNVIDLDINLLNKESEKKILNLLIRFLPTLENIVKENKIQPLIYYLYELAQTWQNYYQNVDILDFAEPKLTSQKLLLVKNIQLILYRGLKLLGIKAPKNM